MFDRFRAAAGAATHDAALRERRVRSALSALELRGSSFEDMHAAVERWLGRPIAVKHWASDVSAPCGLWVGRRDGSEDTIYVDLTSPSWQHIVAHEWGHMLCGHGTEDRSAVALEQIDWLVPASAVRFALARSSFSTAEERDAEAVGDALNLLRLDAERRARRLRSAGGFQGVL